MESIKLNTTPDDITAVFAAYNKSYSINVSVDRKLLWKLLQDHGTMYTHLRKRDDVTIEESK